MLLETSGIPVRTHAGPRDFLAALPASGCLILDQRMPEMSGLDLQAELLRRGIRLPIIFLSAFSDVPTTVAAMKNGAVDFLIKPVNGRELLTRVRNVLAHEAERHARVTARDALRDRLEGLSQREKQVLTLAIAGLANKAISEALEISARTVENHRARIFFKIGVSSLLELMQRAAAVGLPLGQGNLSPNRAEGDESVD